MSAGEVVSDGITAHGGADEKETYSFLEESISRKLRVLRRVSRALDWVPLPSLTMKLLKLGRALSPAVLRELHSHVEVVNIVPNELEAALVLVDFDREPDVPALPEGQHIPLVTHIKVSRLLRTVYSPGETRLCTESASVGWGNEEGL